MTSNIKKMYILLIVVLLKTCKRSRGEKSIIWNTSFTGQTYCRECKSPSTLHFSQMWPFKKEVQQAAPRYADSTQLDVKLKTDKVWEGRVQPDETCWVLSLHFWHPDVYIYLYGGILCSVKLHPWSVLWPYFPLEYFYFRRVFYGEVIHL